MKNKYKKNDFYYIGTLLMSPFSYHKTEVILNYGQFLIFSILVQYKQLITCTISYHNIIPHFMSCSLERHARKAINLTNWMSNPSALGGSLFSCYWFWFLLVWNWFSVGFFCLVLSILEVVVCWNFLGFNNTCYAKYLRIL